MAHRFAFAAALALALVALSGCGNDYHDPPRTFFRTEIFNESRHPAFYDLYVGVVVDEAGTVASAADIQGTIYEGKNQTGLTKEEPSAVKHLYVSVWPTNAGGSSGMVLNETVPFDAVACAGVDPVVLTARLTQEPASPVVHVHASLNCPAWQKDADSPSTGGLAAPALPGPRE